MFKKNLLTTSIIVLCSINNVIATDKTSNPITKNTVANEIITNAQNNVDLKVNDAWARPSLSSNNNSAAYMSITNTTNKQITIIGASAALIANNVELHKSFVDEQGISRMTSIDKIIIPANSTIELEPGGIHVMLFDLKRKLATGDSFDLTIAMENADPIIVRTEIKSN